ncbi:MAG: hypothetical protein ACXV2C_00190 [Candidatus Bathyarchaeia archaeon]
MSHPNWAFIKDMTYAGDTMPAYGFSMLFKHPQFGIMSPFYEMIAVPLANAILEKTDVKFTNIHFTRAFLQVPLANQFAKKNNGVHVDLEEDHYACVYYLCDTDGDTIIYEQTKFDTPFGSQHVNLVEHKRVSPKKGRLVIFDGARYHCSSQPRNSYRCIINMDLI